MAAADSSSSAYFSASYSPDPDLLSICSLTRHFDTWCREMDSDPDKTFILSGIAHGFHLVNDLSIVSPADCHNYRSAENPAVKPALDKLFQDELCFQRIKEVFNKPLRVNAIGSVTKKDTGEPRPITDMSRPLNNSVNDYISCESYRYKSIDDAIALMRPDCFFATVDIKSAYRWVPVYPPHRTLQGFRWAFNGSYKYFTDNFLCFGLKNAPSIFHRISCALTRMMARNGFSNIVNYLDDFLIVASSREECLRAQLTLIHLLHSLGFQVNWSKLSGPSQSVKFLGIILDSIAMQAFVPEDKISALEDQLTFLISHRKASKRDLQRVAGLMNFLAKVVKGGRTFLRRVLDFIIRLKRPFYKARITSDLRKDFCWWLNFCRVFNGKAINIYYSPIVEHAYTDASLSGFGAHWRSHWLAGVWSSDNSVLPSLRMSGNWVHTTGHEIPFPLKTNINYLELYAALQAIRRWSPHWANCHVCLHTDNTQAMAFLNKGSCKNPTAMDWLREIFWLSAIYNFRLTSRHITGLANVFADRLSRVTEIYTP